MNEKLDKTEKNLISLDLEQILDFNNTFSFHLDKSSSKQTRRVTACASCDLNSDKIAGFIPLELVTEEDDPIYFISLHDNLALAEQKEINNP